MDTGSPMKERTVIITARDGSGESMSANLQVCDCGATTFFCFIASHNVNENPHPHLQCTQCDTSYCLYERKSADKA